MVRVFGNSGGRDWREITRKASVTWTESLTEAQTATVSTPLDIAPEDWPARMIIVPMSLRAPRNARSQPPVYGPYDLAAPKYGSPRGTILQGELGHHYGELIADGSANLVGQVVGQVEGFGQHEPFLGWGRSGNQDAFEASYGSGGQGGLSFVGNRVLAELATAASLDDVATGAAVWGFAVYIIISWAADGSYAERLAVWPRHPLVSVEGRTGAPSYAVQPRVGQVRGWAGGAPSAFAPPNISLPASVEPQAGRWKQRPEIDFQEVLNSPAHFPRSAYSAAWNTRRVIAGRRKPERAVGIPDIPDRRRRAPAGPLDRCGRPERPARQGSGGAPALGLAEQFRRPQRHPLSRSLGGPDRYRAGSPPAADGAGRRTCRRAGTNPAGSSSSGGCATSGTRRGDTASTWRPPCGRGRSPGFRRRRPPGNPGRGQTP